MTFLPLAMHHDPRLWWFVLPDSSKYETSLELGEAIHPANIDVVCDILQQKSTRLRSGRELSGVVNRGSHQGRPETLAKLQAWLEWAREPCYFEVEYVEEDFDPDTFLVRPSQEALPIRKIRGLSEEGSVEAQLSFQHPYGNYWYKNLVDPGGFSRRVRVYYICYEAYAGEIHLGDIEEGRTDAWDFIEGDPVYDGIFGRPHNGLRCSCCKGKLAYYERQMWVHHYIKSFADRKVEGRPWKRNTQTWRFHWATCMKCHPWRGSLTLCGNDGMEGAITLAGSGNLTLMEDT